MPKTSKMIKTSIDLPEDQYYFVVDKAVQLRKRTKEYHSLASVIRSLIEQDRQRKPKKSRTDQSDDKE